MAGGACKVEGRGDGPSFGSLFEGGSPLVSSACLARTCSIVVGGLPICIPKYFATDFILSRAKTLVKLQNDLIIGEGHSVLRIRKTVKESTGMVEIAMKSGFISILQLLVKPSQNRGYQPCSLELWWRMGWEVHIKPISP